MENPISLHEYEESKRIAAQGYPFYALLAAAMRQADTENLTKLRAAWPDVWASLSRRYGSPGGVIEEWDGIAPREYHRAVITASHKYD